MIVVSDTTPIISLLKINKLDILQKLYGEVIVPLEVYNELTSNNTFLSESEIIKNCKFIKAETIDNELAVKLLQSQVNLDKGESEAIVLYESLKADILLVDERKARHVAKEMGITIIGTLGLLIEAKRLGYIEKLKPLLEMLISHNIHISENLMSEILKLDL